MGNFGPDQIFIIIITLIMSSYLKNLSNLGILVIYKVFYSECGCYNYGY